MSVSYELLPTDERNTRLPAQRRHRNRPTWKLFALVVTFCLIAIISYKAGQLSVLDRVQSPEPVLLSSDNHTESSTNTTQSDMSHQGKYSVG